MKNYYTARLFNNWYWEIWIGKITLYPFLIPYMVANSKWINSQQQLINETIGELQCDLGVRETFLL